MTTQEIYKIANEMTDQQVLNIIAGWENSKELKCIELYNSLVKLGDSKQLACATVIGEKYNKVEYSEMYNTAYCS